jgi:hypothetical protein
MVLKRWAWAGLVFTIWAFCGEWLYTNIGIDMSQYNTVFIVHIGIGVWLAWKSFEWIFEI